LLLAGVSATSKSCNKRLAEFPQPPNPATRDLRSFRNLQILRRETCGTSATPKSCDKRLAGLPQPPNPATRALRGFPKNSPAVKLHLFGGISCGLARKIHIPACISHNFHKFASGLGASSFHDILKSRRYTFILCDKSVGT